MRALLVFKLGSRVEIITAAFERGIPNTAKFIVAVALPYALMHAYVSQVFFGKEKSDYYNFGQALVATVSTAISVTNNDYPIREWKGVIYLLMSLFTIFLMIPLYTMAIYSEGYRMTVMDYGEEFHTKYVWKSLGIQN
jgi:Polycystin cation channel